MSNAVRDLEALLQTTDNWSVLDEKFQAFIRQHGEEILRELAPQWAMYLAQQNLGDQFYALRSWFADYLPTDSTFVNDLLTHVDPTVNGELHALLYAQIFSTERWQRDIAAWIASAMSDEELQAYLQHSSAQTTAITHSHLRSDRRYRLPDETITALYRRAPQRFNHWVEQMLDFDTYEYPQLFAATSEDASTENALHWRLFRQYATREMWFASIKDLLDIPDIANISHVLSQRHPNTDYEMTDDLLDQVIATFGTAADRYLNHRSVRYGKRQLRNVLQTTDDDDTLLNKLNQMQYRQRRAVQQTADEWAWMLYERDPQHFEKFLKYNLTSDHKAIIQDMLPRIRQQGQLDLYRTLYSKILEPKTWHTQIHAVLQQNKLPGEMRYDLDWLDIQHPQAVLDDATATALYQHNAEVFYDFIVAHLGTKITYTQLREAAQQGDDEALWWMIFREAATPDMWRDELQQLLTSDVPPERINDELDKRHPLNSQPDPALLYPFIERYGDAVLPYLETHIAMLTPQRLRDLLSLNISRAALRRELESFARQQSTQIQQWTYIWLPALYDGQSTFWDTFILRYSPQWRVNEQTKDALHNLLPRIEADGKTRLFQRFYPIVTNEADFHEETYHLLETIDDDEQLLAQLENRTRSYVLKPTLARRLYQRSKLFHPLVLQTLRAAQWRYRLSVDDYAAVIDVARERGDEELVHLYERLTMTPQRWYTLLEELLAQDDMKADDVRHTLETSVPRFSYNLLGGDLMLDLLERHGEPLLPFVMDNIQWIVPYNASSKRQRLLQLLTNIYPQDSTTYWEYFFRVAQNKAWNAVVASLLKYDLTREELSRWMARTTPPAAQNRFWNRWSLTKDNAMKLYQAHPALAREYIRHYMHNYSVDLFHFLQAQDEDLLLNVISAEQLTRWQPDEALQEAVADRLERLYAASPEQFTTHATHILGQITSFRIRNAEHFMANPLYAVIADHSDALLQSATAMRDLLESPNIYVQLFALDMLATDDETAITRITENVDLLQAFLLSRAKPNSKARVLALLEAAAAHNSANRERVLAVLAHTKRMRGKRAIDEKLLIAHTRLQQGSG